MRGVLGRRGRDFVAQYVVDHIFVYRCDQNLPHKSSDIKISRRCFKGQHLDAAKESGISLGCSMPWHRIIISNLPNFCS